MSAQPLRFIHASDFHLEQPLYGVTDVPDHLRALFCDAPYRAAERVFDEALNERVDFLLLSGDVVQVAYAGPRSVLFLLEQFERLAQRGIHVYWQPGRTDLPHHWPLSSPMPANVYRFPVDRVDEVTHAREGEPVARLTSAGEDHRGRLPLGELKPDASGLYSIGMMHGAVDPQLLTRQRVQYLALGGKHQRRTLSGPPQAAHYPGTHQGRSPLEAGPHGCTLVEVDANGNSRSRMLPVDVVRWHAVRVDVDEQTDRPRLEQLLREQVQPLIAQAGERELLLSWTVVGVGPLVNQLRRSGLAEELLGSLQTEFGANRPGAWSFALQASSSTRLPPAGQEEDTLLGDFLRLVEHYQNSPELPLDVKPYLSERQLASPLGAALRIDDPEQRERVLRLAGQLGGELLSGDPLPSIRPQEASP